MHDVSNQTNPKNNPESDGSRGIPGIRRTAEAEGDHEKHQDGSVERYPEPVDAGELLLVRQLRPRIARRKDEDIYRRDKSREWKVDIEGLDEVSTRFDRGNRSIIPNARLRCCRRTHPQ